MLRMRAINRCQFGGGITLILALFFVTQTAYAQADDGDDEFSDFGGFDEDSSDDFDDFGDFGGDGSDDFDDFGSFDDAGGGTDVFGLPTIAGLIVSSETLAGPLAEQLTKELNKELGDLVGYEATGSSAAIDEQFEIMGEELASECAFDPVCMGRVGRDSNIDMIVVGRVEATDGGRWGVTLDLIDAGEGQIDNFVYFMTAPRTVSVQEDLHKQLYRLLRIREEKSAGITKEKGKAQRAIGWTALALGVAAIGTGAYFSYDYIQQQNDFKSTDWIPGARDPSTKLPVLNMTQKEGQAVIDKMNQSRNLSYALYGAGVGVALTGAILLAVSPGKDIYDTYDSRDRNARRRLTVAPVFSPGGLGVQSGFEF